MSMCAYFEAFSPRKLRKLLANPEAIHDLVWADTHDDENSGFFDLHKSWQTLHFLLTGTGWDVDVNDPITQVVLGGEEVGPDAFGYGPARYMTPEQVRKIAAALKNVDMAKLKSKYTAEDFAEAELYSFDHGDFDEEISILLDYVDGLAEFYGAAAERNNAVLIYIQ